MKQSNSYAQMFDGLYAKIPKAVFAAVAFSYASAGGDNQKDATARFLDEWKILHENGIVPQEPSKNA
jgi:hypothetical protein